jgi:hypothetical protein
MSSAAVDKRSAMERIAMRFAVAIMFGSFGCGIRLVTGKIMPELKAFVMPTSGNGKSRFVVEEAENLSHRQCSFAGKQTAECGGCCLRAQQSEPTDPLRLKVARRAGNFRPAEARRPGH